MWSPAGRDVVGEAAVRPRIGVPRLLAQEAEARLVVILDNDIVAVGRRRPEAVDAARLQEAAADDLVEQLERVVVELARRGLRRGSPGTCPSAPTRRRRTASRCTRAASRATARRSAAPVNAGVARSSNATRSRFARASSIGSSGLRSRSACCSRSSSCAARFSASSVARRVGSSSAETTPTTRDASSTCTTGCEYSGAIFTAVCWRDVVAPPIRSGSVEAAPLHLVRGVDHLVERRRDQARQADDVGAELLARVEDPLGRHHHAEVVHLVVVAAEHDADDVLADVVHVALDRREHDRALHAAAGLLLLHVRLEVRDGALHRARALHDLREEHLPRAEEVADDLHAGHQRPLDHVERALVLLPRLLGVLLDEVDDPVHERVRRAAARPAPRARRDRARAASPRRARSRRARRAARSHRRGG